MNLIASLMAYSVQLLQQLLHIILAFLIKLNFELYLLHRIVIQNALSITRIYLRLTKFN